MKCSVCGTDFTPSPKAYRQTKCRKDCGRRNHNTARDTKRAKHNLEFIAVDGEGVTLPDGTHHYVLLSVGSESLYHDDGSELTFLEIVDFLYSQFLAHPDAVFVGFYLGYDFTQWFKSLPEDRAYYLLHKQGIASRQPKSKRRTMPFPVKWKGWEFDTLGMRRFKLRKADGVWMYVNDVGPFFQKSFLAVLDPSQWPSPVVDTALYETIKRGKERRASAKLDAEMIDYNLAENRALSILMGHYNAGLVAAGIQLGRDQWFGPGQAAQKWLDNIAAPKAQTWLDVTPFDVTLAALASYYGGWFEIFCHGKVPGKSYEYDINSAYPSVIASLPCLLHGKWQSGDKAPYPDGLTLVYCRVKGSNPHAGPLPHRDKGGLISRPLETMGWYLGEEIRDAKRAGLIDTVKVSRWFHYDPCDCPPPMAAIRDLYLRRLVVGKKSPEGQALKLIYNSVYGKSAQSLGHPKYANALYASLITSGCRRRILEAIATHPKGTTDLLMVATDGVYFRSPHPSLECDPEKLGAWSAETKHNLTLFLPGVYWDDKTREKILAGMAPHLKSRGVSAKALASMVGDVDAQFAKMEDWEWPTITVPLPFSMTTATQAMARGKWETAGVIGTAERTMNANPSTKRIDLPFVEDGLLRTAPYVVSTPLETTPYTKPLGIRFGAESPDGALDDLFAWALLR